MTKLWCIFFLCLVGCCWAQPEDPYKLTVSDGVSYAAEPLSHVVRIVRAGKTQFFANNFLYPQAVAVQGQRLYVVDTGHHRVSEYGLAEEDIVFIRHIPVALLYPRDCALSPDGLYLYILDAGHNKVLRISLQDISQVIEFGELNGPYGLTVDPYGFVYVADTQNHRIVKYTAEGKYLSSFGREGTRPGQLYYPKDIAVGFSRTILVANSGAGRIDRFTEAGQYLGQIKTKDSGDFRGLFLTPAGVLYYTLPDKKPALIELQHTVQSLSAAPEVFSPNHDGILDAFICTAEVIKPSTLALLLVTAGVLEIVDGPKNVSGVQRISWSSDNIKNGVYQYYFLVQDASGKSEPAVRHGKVIIDCEPPRIESVEVSPAVLALNEGAGLPLISMFVTASEPASIYADIYRVVEGEEYWFTSVQAQLQGSPVVTWNGRNKYLETYSGRYIAELVLRDAAGNKSTAYRAPCAVSVTHPLIAMVSANSRVHRPGAEFTLRYSLLIDSMVRIFLKDIQGNIVKEVFSGERKAGEYSLPIDLSGLRTGDYSLVVEASQGTIVDRYYYAVIIDVTPPIVTFALSRSDMFVGGIDTIMGQGQLDEDGHIVAVVLDVNGTAVAQVVSLNVAARKNFIVEWSGLDGIQRPVPAGSYVLQLTAMDLVGNVQKNTYPIRITSSGPKILDPLLSTDLIALKSPENILKQVRFAYTIDESAGDLYVTTRVLKSGAEIARLTDEQKRSRGINFDYWLPSADVQEGIYNYEIVVRDSFKHNFIINGEIYVVNSIPQVSVTQSTPVIYPLGSRAIIPEVVITAQVQASNILSQYDLSRTADKTSAQQYRNVSVVKGVLSIGTVREYTIRKILLIFRFCLGDGKDANGRYVPDGVYNYTFIATDGTGAASSPVTGSIIVANAQEKITMAEVYINGQNNGATFNPYSGSATVTVNIGVGYFPASQNISMRIYNTANNSLLRTYSSQAYVGSGNYQFVWDGLTDSGAQVGDGTYTCVVNITDEFGNNFDYTATQNNIPDIIFNDDIKVINADGNKYSKPSIKYLLNNVEINYVKGNPEQKNKLVSVFKESSTEYFFLDLAGLVTFNAWDYSKESEKNELSRVNLPDGRTYSKRGDWGDVYTVSKSGKGSIYANNGHYKHSSGCQIYFDAHDVWYKNINIGLVTQVDTGGLDEVETTQSVERALRLAMISSNATTTLQNHQVTINANAVQYQRQVKGQGTGSGWVMLSQSDKYCSEPSITAADGDDVYVVWIQRDTAAGDPYVVCQKVPEKYQPVLDSGTAPYTPMSVKTMNLSSVGLLAVSGSVPVLVSPKDGEVIGDDRILFVWQAPTWAVMTSTNYVVSVSEDQSSFGSAIVYDLVPAQLRFSGATYNYVQFSCPDSLENGVYYWKVGAKDSPSSPIRGESLVQEFQVLPLLSISGVINYPNPFKDRTTIRYKLSQDADVDILIFDAVGRLVRRLDYPAGTEGGRRSTWSDHYNDVIWEAHNDFGSTVINGTYVYEIAARVGEQTVRVRGKMVKWR